jgi:transposase-like protein
MTETLVGVSPPASSEAAGEVVIEVPRDRDGTFTSQVVKKRQRRLSTSTRWSSRSTPRG